METEKMIWGNPEMDVQQFTPQEFVAVCEDKDKWGATCVTMGSGKRGYIFFDENENNEPDDKLYDRNEHGGCGETHYFYAPERPSFNAFVLPDNKLGGHGINYYTTTSSDGQRYLNAAGKALVEPALVKKPGEALDGHWLVCYDLADLRNPS